MFNMQYDTMGVTVLFTGHMCQHDNANDAEIVSKVDWMHVHFQLSSRYRFSINITWLDRAFPRKGQNTEWLCLAISDCTKQQENILSYAKT